MEELTPAQKIVAHRKRCAEDFAYFAENHCKIRNKAGESVPFRLNKVQHDLIKALDEQWRRRGKIRLVILKARQQGFSTFFQAYTYWYLKHRSMKKGFVVANDMFTTKTLFGMLQYTHKQMPERMRPKTERSSVRELAFADLHTSVEVATAGSDALGRGQTLNLLWASELAYWPAASAQDNLSAVLNAVPDTPGSMVVVESTADGVTGAYFDLYNNSPANGFETFFAPWFDTAEYRDDAFPADFGKAGTGFGLTEEEDDLIRDHGLDLGQLWWRRRKLAESKTREIFFRDFPAVPDDAFQNSGAPVFPPLKIQEQRTAAEPIAAVRFYNETEDRFEPSLHGDLTVFHEPVKGRSYVIGADVALGTGKGDYSVAQVMDSDNRQVAVFRSNRVDPRLFADILNRLGRDYNDAEIIIEVMAQGHTSMDRLARDHHYHNLWRRVADKKMFEETTDTIGFVTSRSNKPLIIAKLREDLRNGTITINDVKTLDEMRVYITVGDNDDTAKLQASPGHHDDTVMALALANYINESWTPVSVDIVEQSYLPSF